LVPGLLCEMRSRNGSKKRPRWSGAVRRFRRCVIEPGTS